MNSLVSSHAHATHASLHFHHVIVKCFTNLGVFLAVHKECSLKIFVLVLLSSCKEDLVHRFCLLNHHFNDHLHLSFLSCWLFGGHGGLSFLHSFDLDLRCSLQVLKSFFFGQLWRLAIHLGACKFTLLRGHHLLCILGVLRHLLVTSCESLLVEVCRGNC